MTGVFDQWQFYNPVKIYVGRGSRAQLVAQLKEKKLLIVTTQRGRQQFSDDLILKPLFHSNTIAWMDSVKENPGLTDLQAEINRLQSLEVDAIVAFGGGSSIDAAKAMRIGLALKGQHTLAELLENPVLHQNVKQVPLFALPTTAGTGSEVTPFATIWHHEIQKKFSLAGDSVFPAVAIVDAELTDDLPVSVTISTGLDAINQAAESVWNKNANSITLAFAARALKLGLNALPLLAKEQGNKLAREEIAEASMLAGLAISHTRTALCHSISYPLTAHFGIPHGLACAFTMPEVCKLNLSVDDGRFKKLAYLLTGKSNKNILYEIFVDLNNKLGVNKRVKDYIKNVDSLLALQNEMYTPNRAANNMFSIEASDLENILNKSWG